jgi:hypothetical protein
MVSWQEISAILTRPAELWFDSFVIFSSISLCAELRHDACVPCSNHAKQSERNQINKHLHFGDRERVHIRADRPVGFSQAIQLYRHHSVSNDFQTLLLTIFQSRAKATLMKILAPW